jgi:hypothetical protein
MKDFSAFSCAHSGDFEWVLSVSEGREVKKLCDFHFFRLSWCIGWRIWRPDSRRSSDPDECCSVKRLLVKRLLV